MGSDGFRSCETPFQMASRLRNSRLALHTRLQTDFKAWRISQPFRSCEMSVRGCERALVCQRVVSQLRNTLQNGVSTAKRRISRRGGSAAISQLRNGCTWLRNGTRVPWGLFTAAKIFAEEDGRLQNHFTAGSHFRSGSLLLRNFDAHALSLLFELLLIPNFLLSPFLTFLLILIIQKPILHQNKLELKH
uniref:Uncharacterized protein n=1 Tax=Vitis vinifera TaxID=29760 RepID=A5BS06_VITVI|nr:hypothetical protein VITISV_036422 [Vitis vinifera]